MADALKEEGNTKLKTGDFAGAIDAYTRAIAVETAPALLGNRSLAHLKLKNFTACVEDCTAALQLDARYGKALYRRAQAREALDELSLAFTDIRELLRMEPANKVRGGKLNGWPADGCRFFLCIPPPYEDQLPSHAVVGGDQFCLQNHAHR